MLKIQAPIYLCPGLIKLQSLANKCHAKWIHIPSTFMKTYFQEQYMSPTWKLIPRLDEFSPQYAGLTATSPDRWVTLWSRHHRDKTSNQVDIDKCSYVCPSTRPLSAGYTGPHSDIGSQHNQSALSYSSCHRMVCLGMWVGTYNCSRQLCNVKAQCKVMPSKLHMKRIEYRTSTFGILQFYF